MNNDFPDFSSSFAHAPLQVRPMARVARPACGLTACRFATVVLMLALSTSGWTQTHQRESGSYVLRSSTVSAQQLSRETAKAHNITRDPQHAIVNVTVLNKSAGIDKTVPAQVQVNVRNLTGQTRQIDMRETRAEGRVSYMGTYQIVAGEVVDLIVSAQPEGSNETLTMTYRDRIWGSK